VFFSRKQLLRVILSIRGHANQVNAG